jgi:hypothetical protein
MMLINRKVLKKLVPSLPCSVISLVQVACIILLTYVLISLFLRNKETFEEPSTTPFIPLTRAEFEAQVALSDFFSNLSEEDLKARAKQDTMLQGGEHYKNEYKTAFEELTETDKALLTRVVEEANKLTTSYKNLQQLQWRIAKVKNTVEYGLPHTMGNMIVINRDTLLRPEKELINTMIHEKIHIYQRMNTTSTREWVTKVGFRTLLPSEFATLNKDLLQLRRSNPDLDTNTYTHIKSNLVLRQLYNSNTPTSIIDSKAVGIPMSGNYNPMPLTNDILGLPTTFYCQLEHPYEIMACLISEMITDPSFTDANITNNYVSKTQEWMRKEL